MSDDSRPLVGAGLGAEGAVTRPTLKKCDLVMKGGITSGIVYPRAIAALSKEYQFAQIGGASAGALAAAFAAAAEHARAHGNVAAFDEVDRLPEWFGRTEAGHSNLFHLFQPQPGARALFRVFTAPLGKSGWRKGVALGGALLRSFFALALAGALPGLVCLWAALQSMSRLALVVGVVASALVVLAGVALGACAGLLRAVRALPGKELKWGVCTGLGASPGTGSGTNGPPALTTWLTETLDDLSGKDHAGHTKPLTFGDLRAAHVGLAMVATNITTGRPYTLPFDEHTHLYFDPKDLREFFPAGVVDWMVAHAPQYESDTIALGSLLPLPDAKDLPVVVAVRMSCSFPFLFCPIPLHAVDFGYGTRDAAGMWRPEPCFFVDGGLSSNFPFVLFDKPLPRWPTFGINLRQNDGTRHAQPVYMPTDNRGGLQEWWTRIDGRRGFGGLAAYAGLMFDASRGWRDNLQLAVPGYRDRVVHVGLGAAEGGLNLDMPADTIATLVARGTEAANEILARYSPSVEHPAPPDCTIGLDNQKWVRFRSVMELLEDALLSIDAAAGFGGGGARTYRELIEDPPSYAFRSKKQQDYTRLLVQSLRNLARDVRSARDGAYSLQDRAPRPGPELRVSPRY